MKPRLCSIAALMLLLPLTGAWTLTFDDVLSVRQDTSEVRTADLALQAARAQARSLAYPGDFTVSAQPGTTITTPQEGPFADQVGLTGSVSVSVPLGLSAPKKAALQNAEHAVGLAEWVLELATSTAYLELYTLYQDAWLAQEELGVLRLESDAAEAVAQTSRALFESGDISLAELNRSQEELRKRQTDYLQGRLAKRISWLELAYATGMDPSEDPELMPVERTFGSPPTPKELTQWAETYDPGILAQQERIRQVEATLAQMRVVDLSATFRANVSAFSHNASLSYNVASPLLSASYSFTGGGSASSWNLGFSVNLGLSAGGEGTREAELLDIELARETEKLDGMRDALALQIRSKYQQYLLSADLLEQTRRNLEGAEDDIAFVADRREAGSATPADVLEAQAQLARAEHQLRVASAGADKSRLAVAASAAYLAEYLGTGE